MKRLTDCVQPDREFIMKRALKIGLSARLAHPRPGGKGLDSKTLQYLEQSVAQWIMARDVLVFMVPSVTQDGLLNRSAIRLSDLGPLRSLQLLFALGADSSAWGSANADDPILISLPEGISYTSASGVFLTAVPLPASLPLLAAGLVAVGLRRRRATPLRS